MSIYQSLKPVIDFFINPFLDTLDSIGISNTIIKIGFGQVEWFSITLYDLVSFLGTFIILYIFYRFIYRLVKKFYKLITRGDYLWLRKK